MYVCGAPYAIPPLVRVQPPFQFLRHRPGGAATRVAAREPPGAVAAVRDGPCRALRLPALLAAAAASNKPTAAHARGSCRAAGLIACPVLRHQLYVAQLGAVCRGKLGIALEL